MKALESQNKLAYLFLTKTYLIGSGHKVYSSVVAVILLRQAEGELVVDEECVLSNMPQVQGWENTLRLGGEKQYV